MLVLVAPVAAFSASDSATAGPDAQVLHWLTSAGALGVLAFVVLALLRGWLVTGRTYDRVLSERNRLLELALTSTAAAGRAVEIAQRDRDTMRRIAGTAVDQTDA